MRRKISNIAFLFFLAFFLCNTASAQYAYHDETADFTVSENDDSYHVSCLLNTEIQHSRKLNRVFTQLRLKAIDLIGNYIVLNSLELAIQDRAVVFQAFIDNTTLHFRADVEKITASSWSVCQGKRCITYSCAKTDFKINERYLEQDFDFNNILYMNFRRNKTMDAACALIDNTDADTEMLISAGMQFMIGSAEISPLISRLLNLNKSYQLETSLFENDSLQQALVDSISLTTFHCCPFGRMTIAKILFTAADTMSKQAYYDDYCYYLSQLEGDWYKLLRFTASQRDKAAILPFSESTVFDIIGSFPLALNPFGIRQENCGKNYKQAEKAFAESNIEQALRHLQDEVNFNGINASSLNLSGACYRLLNQHGRALSFLLMAYCLNSDIPYLKGNIVLCLHALNYPDLNKIALTFTRDQNIDTWSKNQIMNLIRK